MGAITVTNLGKAYRRYPNRWSRIVEWLTGRTQHDPLWVLRDISFGIAPGEAVGIVGINGAGKSTLLKIITGTTQPTVGQVSIAGRVVALLELGMGFHPDFTGRQNVYMAGQLQGLGADEINTLMPEIEAFAEIGDYIDQPVRVYSSGMQVRLAFSVAVARRPDVLIVDEALSVGDVYFQHKSFDRIRAFNREGTTLLLVSHDKQAIQTVCNRVILLSAGSVAMQGKPDVVMDYYNAMLAEHQNQTVQQVTRADGNTQTASGTGEATVETIELLDPTGQVVEYIAVGMTVCLRVTVRVLAPIPRLILGYGIRDRFGRDIFGTNTDLHQQPLHELQAGERYQFEITFSADFGPGSYSIRTALTSTETHLVNNYEWREWALVFNVVNMDKPYFEGCVWMNPHIDIVRL